jgi:RNA recognition motif-containing protein
MSNLQDEYTLLVDGFPLSYTADDIKRVFTPFGNVVSARIVRDPMGMSLGFGYISLASELEVKAALEGLNGKRLCERVLKIVRAESPPLPRRPPAP